MQTVSDDRMPGERMLEGYAAYETAFDELLLNSERTVRIFDRALSRAFDTPQRYELMSRILLARRSNRIYIALHDASNVVRDCPRLMMLVRRFSDALRIRQTLPAARGVYDPFATGDDSRFVRRFHYEAVRGLAAIGDLANTRALINRFDEIWEASVPAVAATTLGL